MAKRETAPAPEPRSSGAAGPATLGTLSLVAGILAIPGSLAGLLGLILPIIGIMTAVVSARHDETARKRRVVGVILAVAGILLAFASAAAGWFIFRA